MHEIVHGGCYYLKVLHGELWFVTARQCANVQIISTPVFYHRVTIMHISEFEVTNDLH